MANTLTMTCNGVNRWDYNRENEISYSFNFGNDSSKARGSFQFSEQVKPEAKPKFEVGKDYKFTIE